MSTEFWDCLGRIIKDDPEMVWKSPFWYQDNSENKYLHEKLSLAAWKSPGQMKFRG